MLAEEEENVQAVGEGGHESTTRQSWHLERRCSFLNRSSRILGRLGLENQAYLAFGIDFPQICFRDVFFSVEVDQL